MKSNNKIKKVGALVMLGLVGSSAAFAAGAYSLNKSDNVITNEDVTDGIYLSIYDNINLSSIDEKKVNSINEELEKIGKDINDIYEKNQDTYNKLFENLEKINYDDEKDFKIFEEKVSSLDKKYGLDKLYNKEDNLYEKLDDIYKKYDIETDGEIVELSEEEQKSLDSIIEKIDNIYENNQKEFDNLDKEEDELLNKFKGEELESKLEKVWNKRVALEKKLGLDKLYEKQDKILEVYDFDVDFSEELFVDLTEAEEAELLKIDKKIVSIYENNQKEFDSLYEQYDKVFDKFEGDDLDKELDKLDKKEIDLEKKFRLDKLYKKQYKILKIADENLSNIFFEDLEK